MKEVTLLGVDAGGSRTSAAVADAGGRILARGEAGPGAVRPGKADLAAAAIAVACRDALQRARRSGPAEVLVAGASGAGEEPARLELERALATLKIAARTVVTTDAEIALAGAFGDGAGIVLIAGTGSVAWARLPDGSTQRVGGLGPVLGDDGSAHHIGLEALRRAARAQSEGDLRELLDRLLAQLGISRGELPRWSLEARVEDIAALAPAVLAAARDRVGSAEAIVRRAADDLASLVGELASRFPKGSPIRLAWGGGLLEAAADYRASVFELLGERSLPLDIAGTPVDAPAGAIGIAVLRTPGET